MPTEDFQTRRAAMVAKHLKAIPAIKYYCKEECCAGDEWAWKDCPDKTCPLYPYRLGKNPYHKGKGNPNIGKIGKKNKQKST